MTSAEPLYLGIDVGTQGVRTVAVDVAGRVLARGHHPLEPVPGAGPQEQDPETWWHAVVQALEALGGARRRVRALAVACTSGTVCVLDGDGAPVRPALLYSDPRAVPTPGADASWAVSKLAWLAAETPAVLEVAREITSPGGYLAGRFLGRSAPIDQTQALKFGFEPESWTWGLMPVAADLLPDVVPTGSSLGSIDPAVATATGLDPDVEIVVGLTDGVAGQLACGAGPGRWVTVIGSTMVWKTVAEHPVTAMDHGVYSHRGPGSWWLPGAAANAGARILSTWATPEQLDDLAASVRITPSTPAAYPSVVVGERFPFADPCFEPFGVEAATPDDRYAAEVLGAAFVERWGCEQLVADGCAPPSAIAAAGGAVRSEVWTQLRADVLQLPLDLPVEPSSAFGAAIVAAGSAHGGVVGAVGEMVRHRARVDPDPRWADAWTVAYERFRERCHERRRSLRERPR
ncbi:FGGY-family carbohydrate kinase [Rhabdothermincola salaria]|uniref:FGGY-family carbohydrate kinase n=1 Tax=Rhabdothermincola salaria TaxID=2903142 RepID=UPI001E45272B|nr:FGGY-family carbohydrate kinase [Rhabdothermincola salaria]MCD9622411.1 FGGY-family carbohydrate kinase [Rhabdothermincola salaria]